MLLPYTARKKPLLLLILQNLFWKSMFRLFHLLYRLDVHEREMRTDTNGKYTVSMKRTAQCTVYIDIGYDVYCICIVKFDTLEIVIEIEMKVHGQVILSFLFGFCCVFVGCFFHQHRRFRTSNTFGNLLRPCWKFGHAAAPKIQPIRIDSFTQRRSAYCHPSLDCIYYSVCMS